MNGTDVLTSLREQLAADIAHAAPNSGQLEPVDVSPWVAMSLLQKAVRRGEERFALQAAATLLRDAPDRLWRRLGGIAFEDIGLADLETVSLVTAALAGKRVRAAMGGEAAVARYLVSRMSQAPKCRAADDLLMTAERHPAFERDRLQLAFLKTDELFKIATGEGSLERRALAAWYALGTCPRTAANLRPRSGAAQGLFDHLCETGVPHTLVEVSREGYRRGPDALCPLVSLLYAERHGVGVSIVDDVFPPEAMCGPAPSWCLDMYNHEGKSGLKKFLLTNAETARWVKAHIAPAVQISFLGGIIFRVEGGLMRRRVRWPLAEELRRKMEVEANAHCVDASEILNLARQDIALLNEVRHVR